MDKLKKTIETYNKSALSYQSKFMEMELYHDTYNIFCDLIKKPNAKILDVGCGPGNVTKYLHSRNPRLKITGIDLAPKMIELAKKNNPKATFEVMDCREIRNINNSFDGIICAFCLPYLSRTESGGLIRDISEMLLSDGIIYLSTMEGKYDRSGFETTSFSGEDEVFIYYHQYELIDSTLKESGFEISEFQRKKYPDGNGFLTDMIFIAEKVL